MGYIQKAVHTHMHRPPPAAVVVVIRVQDKKLPPQVVPIRPPPAAAAAAEQLRQQRGAVRRDGQAALGALCGQQEVVRVAALAPGLSRGVE